jgi:hypothetical protein
MFSDLDRTIQRRCSSHTASPSLACIGRRRTGGRTDGATPVRQVIYDDA